ncbi:MAG TPA: hypothetical protein VF142_06825, partial [Longimicrobium sp.]
STPAPQGNAVVSGRYYVRHFEERILIPCGSTERWWVSWGQDHRLAEQFDKDVLRMTHGGGILFVRLAGDTSKLGRHGHLGTADRDFMLLKVIAFRDTTAADCADSMH